MHLILTAPRGSSLVPFHRQGNSLSQVHRLLQGHPARKQRRGCGERRPGFEPLCPFLPPLLCRTHLPCIALSLSFPHWSVGVPAVQVAENRTELAEAERRHPEEPLHTVWCLHFSSPYPQTGVPCSPSKDQIGGVLKLFPSRRDVRHQTPSRETEDHPTERGGLETPVLLFRVRLC